MHVFAVQTSNSCIGLGRIRHFDEGEAARATSHLVFDDGDRCDLTIRAKSLAQVIFAGLKRQIPYIDIHFKLLL